MDIDNAFVASIIFSADKPSATSRFIYDLCTTDIVNGAYVNKSVAASAAVFAKIDIARCEVAIWNVEIRE